MTGQRPGHQTKTARGACAYGPLEPGHKGDRHVLMVEVARVELASTVRPSEASPGSVTDWFSAQVLLGDPLHLCHGGPIFHYGMPPASVVAVPFSGALPVAGTPTGSASLHYLGSESEIIVDV